MASLKYVVVFSLLMMMLTHYYAESMTVPEIDEQAAERHTSNKRSVQEGNKGASNRNGRIELTLHKQMDKGYKQEYSEKRISERECWESAYVEKMKRKMEDLEETVANLKRKEKKLQQIIQRKDKQVSFLTDKCEDKQSEVNKLQKQNKECQARIEKLEEEDEWFETR